MAEFLKKLAAVMFYASLPLLIPFLFSLYSGDGAWVPIGTVVFLLALPAVPQIIMGIVENIVNLLRSLLRPEITFNSAKLIDLEEMRKRVEILTLGETLALTSAAWLIVPFISSIPYLYYGLPPIDALFESMSGWTSTGLSSLRTLSGLPDSIILFRSITQWVGGLGIAVLILTVIRGKEALGILKAEGRATEEIGIGDTVSMIFRTYLALTVFGIALLVVLDMDLFNAVNLTFSGISNGGFFPFDSFGFTDAQKLVLAMMMFAGATSFLFYRKVWSGRLLRAIMDEEFILYVLIAASSIALIVQIGGEDFFNTTLNAISALAAGGFAIGDLSVLHSFPIYLLVLLMLSGGMVGSTTGGIKLWRVLVISKAMLNHIKATFLPAGAIQVVKVNGIPIDSRTVVESATFVFTYLSLFLFAGGLFIAADYPLEDALFIVSSAMGNVGLSTISIPTVGAMGKAFLMILMYLGRIEIFPSLALASFILRR